MSRASALVPAQCADPTRCHCAIGVLTTPDNGVRRRIARDGWIADAAPNGVAVRFLLRAVGLPVATRARLDDEQRTQGDLLFMRVSAREHRLRGRILALHAWLRMALVVCPVCKWVCKADDDTHVTTHGLRLVLQEVDGRLGVRARALVGHLAWHTWNKFEFMHHSYYGAYDRNVLRESRRAIEWFGKSGADAAATDPKLRRALERCRPGGPLTGCGWCPTEEECDGPFPFAVGWLIGLSSALAAELRASELVWREVHRALPSVNRSWGPPAMEDIWLGSVLHRSSCTRAESRESRREGRSEPLTLVSLPTPYAFNGGWHTGRGMEYNTTWLYHNKHELPLISEHARVAASEPPHPALQCAGDVSSAAEDGRLWPYAAQQVRAHRRYMRELRCDDGAQRWCAVVEPRFLAKPHMRHHDGRSTINAVARPLSRREVGEIDEYHRRVAEARQAFRAELTLAGMHEGELMRSDYDYMRR